MLVVGVARGVHFRTMGRVVKGTGGRVGLGEEEALYLLERGGLEVRWVEGGGDGKREKDRQEEDEEEEEEDGGVVMSLQAGYAMLIGQGGLTLERFTVYAGLKRSGYIVLRAPGWDGEVSGEDDDEDKDEEARKQKKNEGFYTGVGDAPQEQRQSLWAGRLFARLYSMLFESRGGRESPLALGPLVGLGVYRSYSQYSFLARRPLFPPPQEAKTDLFRRRKRGRLSASRHHSFVRSFPPPWPADLCE